MDRAKFFAALRRRSSGVFGTSLSQPQVEGTEAILDSCIRNGVKDPHHVANILANVYRETGHYMMPIKETVYRSHKDKNPSDATVIARLDRAWAKGQLSWVRTPYWRDGAFGRGQLQITHWKNYTKLGQRLGVPLRENPDLALDPAVSSDIAVVGMMEGLFTGKKLSDFNFPKALDASPKHHPRRIVNGVDGTDDEIKGYHLAFYTALREAGWTGEPTDDDIDRALSDAIAEEAAQEVEEAPQPVPAPEPPSAPQERSGRNSIILGGLILLAAILLYNVLF